VTVLLSHNDFVNRIAGGYYKRQHIYGEIQTNPTSTLLAGSTFPLARFGSTQAMNGSLPTGVTAFIPTSAMIHGAGTTYPIIIGKRISFGTLDISGASGTFTDGSAMPSETVAGQSLQRASAVFCEVTVALNATPGSITITYKDQDNNTAETTTAAALTASAAVGTCCWVPLNSGDWGATDITAATRSLGTTPTGTLKFFGLIPIATVEVNAESQPGFRDLLTNVINVVKLGTSDVVDFILSTSTANAFTGFINLVGDS
jgi:hypothetical protein